MTHEKKEREKLHTDSTDEPTGRHAGQGSQRNGLCEEPSLFLQRPRVCFLELSCSSRPPVPPVPGIQRHLLTPVGSKHACGAHTYEWIRVGKILKYIKCNRFFKKILATQYSSTLERTLYHSQVGVKPGMRG